MSIFSTIFGKRNANETLNGAILEPTVVVAEPVTPHVAEELFVDKGIPAEVALAAAIPTALELLIQTDHEEAGYLMGYEHHDWDLCEREKARIKAEFTRAIDKEMERVGALTSELQMEVDLLGDKGMERPRRDMIAHLNEMRRTHMKLQEQTLLVAGNSGYAERALTTFEIGFRKGYSAYLEFRGLTQKYQG